METTARVAQEADLDAVVATLTTAFFDDPVWGPAFPDRSRRAAQAGAMWRFFAASSLRYPWTFVTPAVEAVALWLPPGGTELTDEEDAGMRRMLVGSVGRAKADEIEEILEICEQAHPAEPHFYLSLLGTHSDHRGKGIGMALLRENLARIDALGMPAYLESSNPANDARYESAGFVPRERLTLPSGEIITTMWRSA